MKSCRAAASRTREADSKPLPLIIGGLRINLAQRAAHFYRRLKAIGACIAVGEFFQLDDVDRFDHQPTEPEREGALPRLETGARPAADGGALGAVANGLPETFFEQELSHVA